MEPDANDSGRLRRQLVVRAIAIRRIFGVLAIAEPDAAGLREHKLDRGAAGALVGAVAKRRVPGAATAAPPVGASLEFEGDRHAAERAWRGGGAHPQGTVRMMRVDGRNGFRALEKQS